VRATPKHQLHSNLPLHAICYSSSIPSGTCRMKILHRDGVLLSILAFASCRLPGQYMNETINQQFSVRGSPTIAVTRDAGSIQAVSDTPLTLPPISSV